LVSVFHPFLYLGLIKEVPQCFRIFDDVWVLLGFAQILAIVVVVVVAALVAVHD